MNALKADRAVARAGTHHARRAQRIGTALLLAAALCACAPMVTSQPAALAAAATSNEFTLRDGVPVKLDTGYTRPLPSGSQWREHGRLPQGVVYRPLNTVFAIEGRNVHEAYLVVADGLLVGFYLPGEARLSLLDTPIRLPMGENQ